MTCLWTKSHTFDSNSMSRRDSSATSLRDVAGDSPPAAERPVRAADQWKGSGGTGSFPQVVPERG